MAQIVSLKGTLMKRITTTKEAELMSIEEFHKLIVEGKYQAEIDAIVKAQKEGTMVEVKDKDGHVLLDNEGNPKMVPLADMLKKQLPYFVCQADVTERRLFAYAKNFTGYAPMDIDHLTPQQLKMVMERMRQYRWVKEGHASCRQEGGHFIVVMGQIEVDMSLPEKERKEAYEREYKRRYSEITNFIHRELGIEVDGQCKDVVRGLFVSADKDAFIRPDEEVEVFPYENENENRSSVEVSAPINPKPSTLNTEKVFNPQLIKAYVPMHQYKPSKRHSWWIGFAQYLKWKNVPQNQLNLYQETMKAHLMMCGHIQADDPCVRSATEVKEAMAWGFEHSDTEEERKAINVIEEKVVQILTSHDDTEFRETARQLVKGVIGLKQSIQGVPDTTIMPIIVGLMPLAMAYATDVTFRYCDGKDMRLNCMAMIIGNQGGKKSSVKFKLDIWKQPLRESDRKARQKFDDYKQLRKNRKANEKLPPEPTDTIIEVPITISCSTLLKRMKNAHNKHLFSFCEELDTLRKTNGAGSWSSKYDVYRLSFDNGEWGQDFNSDQSESGVVDTAYNWTILGTQGAFEKCFTADNVENGLGGRIFPARMPSSEYEYMPTFKEEPQADVECILKAVDILRKANGFYGMPRLCKRMTQWCNKKADEAREYADKVLDIFRKRSAVIGFRCGVIYHLLEQRDTESNNCLAFAELMAEYCLKNQCEMLGGILMNTTTRINDGTGYRSRNKSLFDELGDEFDWDTLVKLRPQTKYNALRTMIYKWKKDELIEETDKNRWCKKNQQEA